MRGRDTSRNEGRNEGRRQKAEGRNASLRQDHSADGSLLPSALCLLPSTYSLLPSALCLLPSTYLLRLRNRANAKAARELARLPFAALRAHEPRRSASCAQRERAVARRVHAGV